MVHVILAGMAVLLSAATAALAETPAVAPLTVTDYDEGDWYLVRGTERRSYHGMRESWVFNRAMVWRDESSGIDGALLCYSSQSPLPLSGKKQASRWYAGPGNELTDVDDHFTRLTKRNADSIWDHACLPPLQFQIEQHPTAEFEVRQATCSWQFVAVIKGRSGPPLFASPWQTDPGKLTVDLLELYRKKGFDATRHFAEMIFFVAVWREDPQQQATVVFRLSLTGPEVIVPTLPIGRTARRARSEGIPIYAVVLDREAKPLSCDTVAVTASLGQAPPKDPNKAMLRKSGGRETRPTTGVFPGTLKLADNGQGIWKAVVRGLPPGEYPIELRARWKADPQKSVVTRLSVRITNGQFVRYDPERRLLTRAGRPLGPITGSYRGQAIFTGIGTVAERLLHGEGPWHEAIVDRRRPDVHDDNVSVRQGKDDS